MNLLDLNEDKSLTQPYVFKNRKTKNKDNHENNLEGNELDNIQIDCEIEYEKYFEEWEKKIDLCFYQDDR